MNQSRTELSGLTLAFLFACAALWTGARVDPTKHDFNCWFCLPLYFLTMAIGLFVLVILFSFVRSMRKPVPGYRYFTCPSCEHEWRAKTRDCLTPSIETCPRCLDDEAAPGAIESHPEWPTDKSGNLLEN